jgi:acyl-CoA synthetase (AMP-forming)/AMP-acid ligase II
MNLLFLGAFGMTLAQPPSMIYRFATLQDKSIPGSLGEKRIAAYCRKVTVVWVAFFVCNGSMAALTIVSGSDVLWSVYNGGISYILMGILFAGEFIVRKKVQKNIPQAVPLTAITAQSRTLSVVLCYEGAWSGGVYKTWGDFLVGTAKLRRHIETVHNDRWLLYCEDCWLFLMAFTALLQCKKEVLLSANASPAYIAEIRSSARGSASHSEPAAFLTEEIIAGQLAMNNDGLAITEFPPINGKTTSITMFTSGSTGKPKAVQQRLTEFENDNRFILSRWGEEFLCRKLCSTVSQHHIYGLLYSILLPFTAGVPFKRERIDVPEELEKLSDTSYMIITVPAFLKRAVAHETTAGLSLVSPWIFTSGGVLNRDVAEKTAEILGFWPVEVYGSTETSGIAWRQSRKGPEWTAFDNARLGINAEGCLIIHSPYIRDSAGFETADLAEILDNGQFLLKGRMDLVVKIEEKRISLTEIEERIVQSGLAAQACVIPCEDKRPGGARQYLAAAVVLNDAGKERFDKLTKHDINQFWREYLAGYFEQVVVPKKWRFPEDLPANEQGKIKRDDVTALFAGSTGKSGKFIFDRIIEKNENSVTLAFSVPGASPYFDGHFPAFSILPAVAQIELITRFADEHFGTGVALAEIKRVKFTSLIRPSVPLVLKIEKNEKNFTFKISSPGGETVYSFGTLAPCKESNQQSLP